MDQRVRPAQVGQWTGLPEISEPQCSPQGPPESCQLTPPGHPQHPSQPSPAPRPCTSPASSTLSLSQAPRPRSPPPRTPQPAESQSPPQPRQMPHLCPCLSIPPSPAGPRERPIQPCHNLVFKTRWSSADTAANVHRHGHKASGSCETRPTTWRYAATERASQWRLPLGQEGHAGKSGRAGAGGRQHRARRPLACAVGKLRNVQAVPSPCEHLSSGRTRTGPSVTV